MKPDPSFLLEKTGIDIPLIGFYDAPDADPFSPLVRPRPGVRTCVFAFFKQWLKGKTLHITKDNFGCRGAGDWLCGVPGRSHEEYITFLVDEEGLKSSYTLMDKWLDHSQRYQQEHANLLIGPIKEVQFNHLRTVTFFVNPDQLSMLAIGAQYNSTPDDPPPVIAPFGSGCMLLASLFEDVTIPQAIIGSTDIAMRQYIPADILTFTVTVPMFEQLCQLDKKSFLSKSFLKRLKAAREEEGS